MKHKTKILFLLKKNTGYGTYSPVEKSGLYNSARMTASKLKKEGYDTHVTICVDSNSIDKEVHQNKPTICVLEAIWFTPEKLREVAKLHPKVKFIVRVHSELPFLANEGNAIGWLKGFAGISNVSIAPNSAKTYRDLKGIVESDLIYLPNIYDGGHPVIGHVPKMKTVLDIGCFGAIRPLKNQLIQAVAAIKFADSEKMKLRFHINSSRVEQGGNSVLKNIRALFAGTKHELVEHPWMERHDFLRLIDKMEICMQVSFTESFNIVAADCVSRGVPLVVSNAIAWMANEAKAYPNSTLEIVKVLKDIKKHYVLHQVNNVFYLDDYNAHAIKAWKKTLK